jgi:cation transport ATPase
MSRKTMRIVRQNIVFALLVKAVVLALGAIGAPVCALAVCRRWRPWVLAICQRDANPKKALK